MGGIIITPGTIAMLADLANVTAVKIITRSDNATNINAPGQPVIYRPPQWNSQPAVYVITTQPQVGTNGSGITDAGTSTGLPGAAGFVISATTSRQFNNPQTFVFDAVFKARQNRKLEMTKYPVQTGYNNSYNAILRPAIVTLEVGMSDAMDMYNAGMWVGNTSKSVSAFQQMLTLQQQRTFLTVSTRLNTWPNMMITDIDAPEDNTTFSGAKFTVTFEQQFFGTIAIATVSSRPQVSNTTSLAQVQGQNPSSSLLANNKLPNPTNSDINEPALQDEFGTTQSPGEWSSNPTSSITTTLGAPRQ